MSKFFDHQSAHNLIISKHYKFQKDIYQNIDKVVVYINQKVNVKINNENFTEILIENFNKEPIIFDNNTYLILISKIGKSNNDEWVEIFYCDYDQNSIGVIWFNQNLLAYDGKFVINNDDNYLLPRVHLEKGLCVYFNSFSELKDFYEEQMRNYKKISDNEEYCGKYNFGMVESEEKLKELSKLGAPCAVLKPNCECPSNGNLPGKSPYIDLMWKLIFIPSSSKKI